MARLLIPALRAEAGGSFEGSIEDAERALRLGVGGFILFGGDAASVSGLIQHLRSLSSRSILFASDLERGAGQQFSGATSLPPQGALGYLDDVGITRRAGELTGREAASIGVDWVFAPVADLDNEAANPIVGPRAFGSEPLHVARHVAAWVEGCRSAGARTCAKHFPGHGRALQDSHVETPLVEAGRDALDDDLAPFRAAFRAGVDSVMTAHVAYPAMDPSASVATLSRPVLDDLLRGQLGFTGAVVTDALNMKGVAAAGAQEPAVAALAAGCDLLLYPTDIERVIRSVEEAVARGELDSSRIATALVRSERLHGGPIASGELHSGGVDDEWALMIAERSCHGVRGDPRVSTDVCLFVVDDDLGGPHQPPPRHHFSNSLAAGGISEAEKGTPLVALFADTRAWKGRVGLSTGALREVRKICISDPEALVIIFGHPRIVEEIPFARNVVCAWGGEPLMQKAAGWFLGRGPRSG